MKYENRKDILSGEKPVKSHALIFYYSKDR